MGIWDAFSEIVEAVTPWGVVEAEAPAAAEEPQVSRWDIFFFLLMVVTCGFRGRRGGEGEGGGDQLWAAVQKCLLGGDEAVKFGLFLFLFSWHCGFVGGFVAGLG
jgi:hypothetical protein